MAAVLAGGALYSIRPIRGIQRVTLCGYEYRTNLDWRTPHLATQTARSDSLTEMLPPQCKSSSAARRTATGLEPFLVAMDSKVEQIVKGLSGAVSPRSRCFALDGGARRKDTAVVLGVLRRNPRRDGLHALEATARVKRRALGTRVSVRPAAWAAGRVSHVGVQDRCAAGAAHDVAKPRHIDVFRTILGNPSGAGRSPRFRRGPCWRLDRPVPVFVLVASDSVLAVAHLGHSSRQTGQLDPFFTTWYKQIPVTRMTRLSRKPTLPGHASTSGVRSRSHRVSKFDVADIPTWR